jgi:DNA-binding Lrp family transcriptional regulator
MLDSFTLDEVDQGLVNVLQIEPRVSWAVAGQALGINAATAGRRWKRLQDAGLARVITYPRLSDWARHRCMAIVEVDCEPAAREAVIESVIRVPRIASTTIASSGRDLTLTVLTVDLAALSDLVLRELNRLLGVRGTRTHIVTRLYSEGNKWRLDALDPAQRALLVRQVPRSPGQVLAEADRDLLAALGDGRRTFAELAALTSTSVSTARRRLARTIREQTLAFRCETAQPLFGWPVSANFWTKVPPNELDAIARKLIALPEIRMCAAVTGVDNLLVTLWLRSLADSQRFEEQLARQVPSLVLSDRTITLRTVKRMGCLLDEAGRSTSVIPVDPWSAG